MNDQTETKRATQTGKAPLRVVEFTNPSGQVVWRVTGTLANGERVRKNFPDQRAALACRMDLENQSLGWASADVPRVTHLSEEQIRAAEYAFGLVPSPGELARAVEWWKKHGAQFTNLQGDAVTLSVAFERFEAWVEKNPALRPATRTTLVSRVSHYVRTNGDLDIAAIQPAQIEAWLTGLTVSPVTKNQTRRCLSRFFSWCISSPQRYACHNPAKEVRIELPERGIPQVFTVDQIRRLLSVARAMHGGKFLRFVVLQVFGGMRPTEATRIATRQINLADREIRIEGIQSKVGRARTVHLDEAAVQWLKACPAGATADPMKHREQWDAVRTAAGLTAWIKDGLRHTSISMKFRATGSYGHCAEWAGNSEAIIKGHYQGRVSSTDAATYWALTPEAVAAADLANIVPVAFEGHATAAAQ